MAKINNVVVKPKDVIKDSYTLKVNVKVVGVNWTWIKVRLRIAVMLCNLAAWVGGIGLEVNQQVGVIVTNKPAATITKTWIEDDN